MNPKIRKLFTDPRRFVADMVRNRVKRVERHLPRVRRVGGKHRFSVVIATDGTARHLNELLESLARQTLAPERHIEVIIVGYGGNDAVDSVARNPRAFPLTVERCGDGSDTRASAWNRGLERATGDWVTFVDPDEFVDETYFERVDQFLQGPYASELALLFTKQVAFLEGRRIFKDNHPLRFRFGKGGTIRNTAELARHIQPTVDGAFFRLDRLRKTGRRFPERLTVGLSDAHFVGHYVIEADGADVGFVTDARLYQRHPGPARPKLERAAEMKRLLMGLELGYCQLVRSADRRLGSTPMWLQWTMLYAIMPYLRRYMNHEERVDFETDDGRERLMEALRHLFTHIDDKTIQAFDVAGCKLVHRTGMLGLFKDEEPDVHHVRIVRFDPDQKLIELRYVYGREIRPMSFSLGNREIAPRFDKLRRHELFGSTFALERVVWLYIGDDRGRLRVKVDGQEARLWVRGKSYLGGILTRRIRARMTPKPRRVPWYVAAERQIATSAVVRSRYQGALLFLDRDVKADDNAEHLYRYLLRHRPDIPAFFILRRESSDWERLEAEGFRLIEFGSVAHRHALIHAKHVISSHAAPFVLSVLPSEDWGDLLSFRFTFLQHGVIKDDLSNWLNGRPIDCFVTASPAEYASIVESGSPYRFTEREVILSGLPRHDALGAASIPTERKLLIMPTWRQSIAGELRSDSSARAVNPAFYDSEYATRWKSLLHSPVLRQLAQQHGYAVQFFPHANVEIYLDWFAIPSFIECRTGGSTSIQQAFQSASFMLTDYSSTAFDMAYLRKPTVYYQFDKDDVFGGGHTTKKGYFEYERDGFGPVCYDEPEVLRAVGEIMAANGLADAVYRDRMERAFAHRDGNNCARVLDAIFALDRPRPFAAPLAEKEPRPAAVPEVDEPYGQTGS